LGLAGAGRLPHNRAATYTTTEIQVQRIAKQAAETSKAHTAQFANLAALARTVQSYIPTGKKQRADYAQLACALVDSAEHYKSLADTHDVFFLSSRPTICTWLTLMCGPTFSGAATPTGIHRQ
jgi:hypothetical protein